MLLPFKSFKPVSKVLEVKAPRPLDHQLADAVNRNADALLEVQALLAKLIAERDGAR